MTGTLAPCVGVGTTITSGTTSVTLHLPNHSCLSSPLANVTGTTVFNWNTGASSTFQWIDVQTQIGGTAVVVKTGTIVSGAFQGKPAKQIIAVPNTSVYSCVAGPGYTATDANATLAIGVV